MRAAAVLTLLTALCLGHGGTYPNPPQGGGDTSIPTPTGGQPSTPGRPGGPSTPGGRRGRGGTPAPSAAGAEAAEWQMWWERNREHIVKMRGLLRRSTATTGLRSDQPRDPMREQREEIRKTLRDVARGSAPRSLRAAAVMALGRMGSEEDAFFFLRLLRENREAATVLEAAAVALGILPPLDGPARDRARVFLRQAIRGSDHLPTRAHGLTVLAAGLRARHDTDLVLALLERGGGRKLGSQETADLIYALGLSGHPLVVPEVMGAVRDSTFARRGLTDLQRAHAVQALACVEAPRRVELLTTVLRSRRALLQTRRSAAMVLARLLRETDPAPDERAAAERALLRTLRNGRDRTLRGYAALALGGARPPHGVAALQAAAESDPDARVRPYCLLALGLAARDAGDGGQSIRRFLAERLRETGELDQAAATSIALGLARAHEATSLLLERLVRNTAESLRGAAAQGLGLMESRSAHVMQTLLMVAEEERKKARLLEDVALALGFSGRRDVALKLVDLLRQSTSSIVQGRILVALGHLDHAGTIAPLHAILRDRGAATPVREFASVSLAFLGDRREQDVLFDLDAYFNLYATTLATHELMRLY